MQRDRDLEALAVPIGDVRAVAQGRERSEQAEMVVSPELDGRQAEAVRLVKLVAFVRRSAMIRLETSLQ